MQSYCDASSYFKVIYKKLTLIELIIKFFQSGDNSKVTDIKLVVKYGSDHLLTFNFDNKTWYGYWILKSVSYDYKKGTSNNSSIVLKSSSDIVAPLTKSYHSGSPVTFFNRSANSSLKFTDLQVSMI